MNPFRRRKARRKLLDVHFRPLHQPKKIVSILRRLVSGLWGSEEVLDLRKNFSKQPEFRMIVVFLVIGIMLFSFQKIFTRAEVADFFPSTCLGTWENPQNAQGEPETLKGDPASRVLDKVNSALFGGTTSEIFCGSFIPPDYETKGEIKSVGLTLILQVGEKKVVQATTTQATTTEVLEEPPPTQAPEEKVVPEGNVTPEDSTTTPPASFWIKDLLAIPVFAQEVDPSSDPPLPSETLPPSESVPAEPPSTTTIIGPPIFAPLEPISTSTETPIEAEVSGTGTAPAPVVPEPTPDENFLKVSYSLDGQTWFEAGKINQTNWPNFTITLPLTSWEDLKKLQVSIEGIKTILPEPLPVVYLDGLFIEVTYELPPLLGGKATSTAEVTPPKQELVTYDPRSEHKCSVDPFSQVVRRGEAVDYYVSLRPSSPLAGFKLLTGDLPQGISAVFDQIDGFGEVRRTLTISAADSAQTGSFNIVVVYELRSDGDEFLPNFCQLNLIIE